MLTSGGLAKTQNYRLTFWWPTEGDSRDFRAFAEVGQWVQQNIRVLDKKTSPEVAKLLADQFPKLVSVDVVHANGPMARWTA